MSTLAERLRKLARRDRYGAAETVGAPESFGMVAGDIWPELCAVVEAAEKRRKAGFTRPFSGFAQVEMNESLDELARRMDEEGL